MSKKIIKILAPVFVLGAIFSVANFAFAATPDLGLGIGNTLGLSSADPKIIIVRIIQIFLGFLGLIAVSFIIYAGFLWMTAAGNEDKVDQAKKTLVSAIIGLLIILSAFAIATFILNNFLAATGNGTNNGGGGNNGGGIGGVGVIGECSVENVYPEPNQQDVKRNTSIMVTFKEAVDPLSLCQSLSGGRCNGSLIRTSNVLIYKTNDGVANALSDVKVFGTADQKTFVFVPSQYLGSPSENIWYSVNFTNSVRKPYGHSIFESCAGNGLQWQFQVSNKIDSTPPQVKDKGVFPPPDSGHDSITTTVPTQATGSIIVNNQPSVYAAAASTGITPTGTTPAATVVVDPLSIESGTLTLAINPDGLTATLTNGSRKLGAARFNGRTINFSGIFSLTAASDVAAGNSWTINVTPARQADTLTVGSFTYVFVKTGTSPAPNQIEVGATKQTTAQNIAAALNAQNEVSAAVSGSTIIVKALRAEKAGNNIILAFGKSSALDVTAMSGGSDGGQTITSSDLPDQPRNTVIQINFNEPILPSTVVGTADQVNNVIRIVNARTNPAPVAQNGACAGDADCLSFICTSGRCVGDNNYLKGKWSIANQYQTLEFQSDNQCGVNGCGEPIYCLPENGQLRVEIMAASLNPCSADLDCVSKSPYNKCSSVCQDASNNNYPQANISALNGVTDSSFNSLDGNRDGNAQGPVSFYNANSPVVANGDNFSWSFFINDKLDVTPPTIDLTLPSVNSVSAVDADLKITFSKLMMISTLKTGSTDINNGQKNITHKNINIWNLANKPVGYWIESDSVLNNQGVPIKTFALIKHLNFDEAMSFRAQVGSAVRDIYQNCFKPASGPGCVGSPSCCNGTPTANLNSDGNCP
jgi:hypothetical protein